MAVTDVKADAGVAPALVTIFAKVVVDHAAAHVQLHAVGGVISLVHTNKELERLPMLLYMGNLPCLALTYNGRTGNYANYYARLSACM